MKSALGYVVQVAENGRKGLEWLQQHPGTDLVLMDYMMPKMNGAALLKELDAAGITIPVLLISGMLPEPMMKAGHVLGRPILYKPFTIAELSEKAYSLLHADLPWETPLRGRRKSGWRGGQANCAPAE